MAKAEHLAVLMEGVNVWNDWKSHHRGRTSLSGLKLRRSRLGGINFNWADLRGADLRRVNLDHANPPLPI
jgi:uncharacterized protein YjbI with pentapeptide repeats